MTRPIVRHKPDVSKQRGTLEFIAMALMFVNGPIFYTIFDDFIDLASPVELLGATVDSSSVDNFMVSDSSEIVLHFSTVTVLRKANIKSSEYIDMLRIAIKSEEKGKWIVDQPSTNYFHFSQEREAEASLMLQNPVKLSQILLAIKTMRAQEADDNELAENAPTSESTSDVRVPTDQPLPSSTVETAELAFLDDIDQFFYHSAIQLSNGLVHEFADIVHEIEKDEDENIARNINELADVQYADGFRGQLSPLEYACHMGYADIVKYLLDREDVVKSMRRGSYLINAKRRQRILEETETAAKAQEQVLK